MSIRRTSNRSSQDTGFYNPEFFADVGSRIAFSIDPDADAYIAAVEAADGESLESPIKQYFTDFILGCKYDNIWNSVKGGCILVGARTRLGSYIDIKTKTQLLSSYNFVDGDYSRSLGLSGNGSSKYLDSNISHNVMSLDNGHVGLYVSKVHTAGNRTYIRSDSGSVTGLSKDTSSPPDTWVILDTGSSVPRFTDSTNPGFRALSRNASGSFIIFTDNASTVVTRTSSATPPGSGTFNIFANKTPGNYSDSTLSFYSVGEYLDVSLLNSRVTTLIDNIYFFINTGLDAYDYNSKTVAYVNAGYRAGGSLS